jgi:hypothetical protein
MAPLIPPAYCRPELSHAMTSSWCRRSFGKLIVFGTDLSLSGLNGRGIEGTSYL